MSDPLLTPLAEAADDASRQRELERVLVEHATPTIEMVVARFTRSDGILARDDADDVVATVSLRLVRKLQSGDADEEQIRNFEDYVATLTYNTIHDYLRQRFPERNRLKNRIRQLLASDERFALWNSDDGMAAGFLAWRGRNDLRSPSIDRSAAFTAMLDRDRLQDAVEAVLRKTGGPVALDALVRTIAELWDVREQQTESADESVVIDPLPSHAATFETRQVLEVLWKEIGALPPNQRVALLLNLRDPDGVNAVALFVIVGVARFREIAEAMGMAEQELAAVWEALPMDDLTIAARLGMTRQQVINLRRAARERLARRTVMFRAQEGRAR